MNIRIRLLLFILVWIISVSAYAEEKTKDSCVDLANEYEQLYKIPIGLLKAISIVEARLHPWSLNKAGSGYYFKTKEEMEDYTMKLHSQGITNFDVGCMQINIHFHGKNFKSLQDAINPALNMEYAARFLKQLYDETGNWKDAVSYYHSRINNQGAVYAFKVLKSWVNV